ncbi:MAG TPA: caspase family protein [Bacteroidia bacterium]|nr:caspase family protein [Bacteroidia bacterium]
MVTIFFACVKAHAQWEYNLTLPLGHTAAINDIDISPNGKYIVTASDDNTAKLWDLQSGKLLRTFEEHTFWVNTARFSPDGDYIITASDDGTILKWHTVLAKALFAGYPNDQVTEEVSAAWFSNDGQKIYSVSSFTHKPDWSKIIEWSRKGEFIKEIFFNDGLTINYSSFLAENNTWAITLSDHSVLVKRDFDDSFSVLGRHTAEIYDLKISPDGQFIASASTDSTVKIWDVKSPAILTTIHTAQKNYSVSFSPDSRSILILASDNSPSVWDISGKLLFTVKDSVHGLYDNVNIAEYSPDGRLIITAGYDDSSNAYSLNLWEASAGKLVNRLKAPGEIGEVFKFSHDGRYLVTGAEDGNLLIWDTRAGKLLHQLPHESVEQKLVSLSDNDRKIFVGNNFGGTVMNATAGTPLHRLLWDGGSLEFVVSPKSDKVAINDFSQLRVMDINTGITEFEKSVFDSSSINLTALVFSPTGDTLYSAGYGDSSELWDIRNKRKIRSIEGNSNGIGWGIYSPCGRYIATIHADSAIKIWSASSGNYLFSATGEKVHKVIFSTDGSRLYYNNGYDEGQLWDINKKKRIKAFTVKTYYKGITEAFSPSGNILACIAPSEENNSVIIRDAAKGKIKKELTDAWGTDRLAFNTSGRYLVTAMDEGFIRVWETSTWKIRDTINFFYNSISNQFSVGENHIAITTAEGTVKLFSLETGNEITTTILMRDSINYMTVLPNGYYRCTPGAAQKLYYTEVVDLGTIGFDQLDIKYNRPDKVLEALSAAFGTTDSALIAAYRQAYEKRIKRLGIDTAAFDNDYTAPYSGFKNDISFEQFNPTLELHLVGSDFASNTTLKNINVWVNECPLWGREGINIGDRNINFFDSIVKVPLSDGENKIEISVINKSGIESYREPLYVNYAPRIATTAKTYFIGIGIDTFKSGKNSLNYSIKDIKDLAQALKDKLDTNLIIIDTLYDYRVTKENILSLKNKLLQTGINDKIIVSYSGHGLLDKNYDYFLSTYDADFQNPSVRGLPYTALEYLLDSIPARQKLLLLDACHSGEIDKEMMTGRLTAKADTAKSDGKKTGMDLLETEEEKLGLKNSFELMQEIFVNVSKGTGTTVISAAGGLQYAYEQSWLGNGAFTYSVLQKLKDGSPCTVQQLRQWVGEEVLKLTGGKQRPTSRTETSGVDWAIW